MASAENLLISAVITSGNKNELVKSNFTSDNMAKFSDQLFFILESRSVPSRKVFKSKFPRFIIQDIPASDIPNLVKQCKDNKVKADLTKTLYDAVKQIEYGEDPKKVANKLEKDTRGIQSQFGTVQEIEVMGNLDMWANRYTEKRNKVKEGRTIGMPYGIPTIDRLTGGMLNKELITIAARVKIGKSWVMCNAAANSLMAGFSPMYLSLEMDWDAIANRVFTIISYHLAMEKAEGKKKGQKNKIIEANILPNKELNLGELEGKKVLKVMKEIRSVIKSQLHVPDIKGKFSISNSQRLIESINPDIVFFDYFGLTQQTAGTRGVENWVQASEASKLAKSIARAYDIPYVLGAQLNRSGAQSESPKLEHISLTDSISQDSDKVFMLKTLGRRKKLQVICEKYRGSYDGWKVNLDFDVNIGKLHEMSTSGVDGQDDDEGDEF